MIPLSYSLLAAERPRIGLVLSGGGAKGAAHIGVLKVLEANRIPIDYIAGTSIGAYVGGMYALGYSATEIETIMMNTDWTQGYSDTIPREELSYRNKGLRDLYNIPINMGYSDNEAKFPAGLLRGQSMSRLLRQSTNLVQEFSSFDQLSIPYRAVATNLETSAAVILDSGSIVQAMQASASVPGALAPTVIDGKLLIDGGIANNLPVDVAKAMGADIIIAVDIGSPLVDKKQLNNTIDVLSQLSTMLTNASVIRQKQLLTKDDILIRPQIDELSTTDFSIMQTALLLGKEATQGHLERLLDFQVSEDEYASYVKDKQWKSELWRQELLQPVIRIVIDNDANVNETLIRETFDITVGENITTEKLDEGIERVYALDLFERVDAEFNDTDEGRVLTLITRDKSWGPNYFQLGFSWEDDFSNDSIIEVDLAYTLTNVTANGGQWRNELMLGYNKMLATEFYQPLDPRERYFSRARIEFSSTHLQYYEDNALYLDLIQKVYNAELGLGVNYANGGSIELGGLSEIGSVSNDTSESTDLDYTSYGAYLKFGFDDLDSINFPTSGNRFTLNMYLRHEDYQQSSVQNNEDYSLQIEADWRGAIRIKHHIFMGIASFATVDTDTFFTVNTSELGGFLNLSGYHQNALFGSHKVFSALVYQYDLGRDMLGLTQYPLYLGTSLEAGNVWQQRDAIDLGDLIYSGSLFLGTDTGVGPTALGFGFTNTGEQSVFLFMGNIW
ncbi:patatin-like phospholipase family protein [Shewanella surugensis]|uniref:Patatin-like phospholipase family protein n=2 Tax=Shewanella surugensis TaxID=212020 RepID=A0ABT0LE45_9GAMM|nr:patatin-like phospholipase family protein [Shewanella surugensis]MCL1125760.1 patatin-like phospholipase family protein [Shewanella surugensis]